MIDISKKTLLNKLYSYRTENSPILLEIEKERLAAIDTRDKALVNISELENLFATLNSKLYLLSNEGEELRNNIACFINADDLTILTSLEVNFDPAYIKMQLDEKLPLAIEKVKRELDDTTKKISSEESTLNETIIKIEELSIRNDEAISNQYRLNHYFDLALSGSANFTREEVTSLLGYFDLNENEIRESAKILMFPEDILYDYENGAKDTPVVEEPVAEVITKEEPIATVKEAVIEAPVKEEIPEVKIPEPIIEEPIKETVVEESAKEETIVLKEEEPETPATKEYLIEYLKSNEIDYLDFTNNDFEKMLANFDRNLFNKNIGLIVEFGFDKDIFADNVDLFFDKELRDKIELLTINGKKTQDINLNPSILTKYKLSGLIAAIEELKANGLDPKNVPLMAY